MITTDADLQLAYAGMHPDRRATLCRELNGSASALDHIWSGRVQLPVAAVNATRVSAHQRRQELAEGNISTVHISSKQYPPLLKGLHDPPPLLFVRGDMPREPGVAIVGSRRATGYGIRLAEAFGRAMADDGRVVVSGLAKGIDAAAHRGSLSGGDCRGVAVLGNGVDQWYPAANRGLGERLLRSGAIVSEYPPGTRPAAWRFPPRNRIIVGLARIVLVVEAGMPGGAMITARMAVDEHRELFAVPGDIGRPASVGCNLVIRDGAWPVLSVDDFRESVDRVLGPSRTAARGKHAGSPILDACDPAGTSVDVLAERCGRSVAELLAQITDLELDGRARYVDGRVVPC